MGMFGIRTRFYFLVIFFFLCLQNLTSQTWGDCTIEICTEEECNDVNVAFFTPSGGVSFCEDATVPLINNSPTDFSYYVIDWTDGNLDTVYTKDTLYHEYHVPDSILCNGDIGMQVCFKGVLECGGENISCAWGSLGFILRVRPKAKMSLVQQECVGVSVNLTNTSCNADSVLWKFGDGATSNNENAAHIYSSPGLKKVTLIVWNECGVDSTSKFIEIVSHPLPLINWSPNDDTVCVGQTFIFEDITNQFGTNTVWNIQPNDTSKWMFTDTLMNVNSDLIEIYFKKKGNYTVKLTASNECGTVDSIQTITVLDGPTVSLNTASHLCIDNAVYDPSANYTGQNEIISYLWQFENGNPASSTVADPGNVTFTSPGVNTVSLTLKSECGLVTSSTDVVVDALPVIIMPQTPGVYCSGSGIDTLIALPPGGVWSGPGISSTGVFNPANVAPGTHTLTYTAINGECEASSSISITVVLSESLILQNEDYCEDAGVFQLTASPAGGNWSSQSWLTIDGIFNPSISGPGIFGAVYQYADLNGCVVEGTATVTIQAFPVSQLTDTTVLCNADVINILADALNLTLSPGTGDTTWFFDGIPNNGSVHGNGLIGFHTVDLIYTFDQCTIEDSAIIEFISAIPLAISDDTTVCINDNFLQLETNLGGNWTGPGINPSTGIIDLQSAGNGTFTYTFIHQAGTSCEQIANVQVNITDPGINLNAGPLVFLCEEQQSTYQFSLFSPPGGNWSGTGIIDAGLGIVDLSVLKLDSLYTYAYCLTDTSVIFCTACKETKLLIHSLPYSGFELNGSPCEDLTFTASVDSCDTAASYVWTFGDGQTGTGCNVNHVYLNAGDYNLSVTATSSFGCVTSSIQNIHVTAPPIASFTLLDDESCAPFAVEVNNTSSGEISQQLWIIGSDSVYGLDPGLIIIDGLANDSLVEIELQVSNGCANITVHDYALVHPYPIVNFGFNVDEGCSPLLIEFGNTTQGNPDTWEWDLGNGSIVFDSVPIPQFYSTPPDSITTYTVQLISTNECGADTAVHDIVVYPPDVTAFIQLDTVEGCQPLSVSAHSLSTAGATVGWQIIGPDGQVTGSNDPDPVFILNSPGLHTVLLTASRCGSDVDTAYVNVLPAPKLNFITDPVVCQNAQVMFTNLSEDVTSISWDLGDGTISNLYSPLHTYLQSGIFNVSLSAVSLINNCPSTIVQEIEVKPQPQLVIDNSPKSGCPPLLVNFQNSGDPNLNYIWNFNDSTSIDTLFNPGHVFHKSGAFLIEVYAYDEFICFSDTVTIPVIIHPTPVSAFDFEKDSLCGAPMNVLFNNNSSGATLYSWSFGDGTISNFVEPLHTYAAAGSYDISLITGNEFACFDTVQQSIEIYEQPVAGFILPDIVVCEDEAIEVINTSVHNIINCWLLNGFDLSNTPSPDFIIPEPGFYEFTLITKYNNYCSDTFIYPQQIQVVEKPVADFSYTADQLENIIGEVQFTNHSSKFDEVHWDFGDGAFSSEENPQHEYDLNRNILVTLIAENNNDGLLTCYDTIVQAIAPEWITTFFAPNAFSPDHGEELVRVFQPVGIGLAEYEISVYSPWGQRVWHSDVIQDTHPAEHWNGRINNQGEILPQGAFSWLAKIVFVNGDSKIYKGSVTLLR